jgi:hypothetical protein
VAPGIAWQDTISSKDQRGVLTQGLCILTSRSHIFYWACLRLETPPHFFELGRVGEEGAAAVDDFVGQDGLPAVGGRGVGLRNQDGLRQGQIFLVYAVAGDGMEVDSVSFAE